MGHGADAPIEWASNPALTLFDTLAFATLMLLTLTEHFEGLPGALAALASGRCIRRA